MPNPKFAEFSSKTEYECKKCNKKIKYAKFFGPNNKILTIDGEEPNGLYGKQTNVFTTSVLLDHDHTLHICYPIEWPIESITSEHFNVEEVKESNVKQTDLLTPQAKELDFNDLGMESLRKEVLQECAIQFKIDGWIANYLKIKLGGESPNPAKVGMWHKLISERLARSHESG